MTNAKFMRDWSCSTELQKLLGKDKISRPEMMKVVWEYIKSHNLQNPKNKREIIPDTTLGAVVGSNPVPMLKLAGLLGKHLS